MLYGTKVPRTMDASIDSTIYLSTAHGTWLPPKVFNPLDATAYSVHATFFGARETALPH